MQKKYQIFVSSTFRDLVDERQDAIRNILDLGHIPAGMELFPAADTEQLTYIKKVIDECDYYVLIMGGRYGSLDAEGISFTEREYDYAVETGKVVLAFVHGDTASIPVGKSDTAPRLVDGLNQFRQKVMAGRLVREWTTREALEPMVLKAIVNAINTYPAVGWVRGDAVASQDVLMQINELRIENDRVNKENRTLRASLTPKIEGLASLDDSIKIRYTYTSHYRGGSSTEKGDRTLTWKDVFKAIGPRLMSPSVPTSISTALSIYLKENKGSSQSVSVLTSDMSIIKSHFIALGLIRSYNAKAINAGITEFLELTELGRARLTELLAVRVGKD